MEGINAVLVALLATIFVGVIIFIISLHAGQVAQERQEIRKWARDGQCTPSRYQANIWVCREPTPSTWIER